MRSRLVPQWLAVVICTLSRHRQKRYAAWKDGIEVVVYTCRCGRKQRTLVLPANRRFRRAAR